MTKATVIAILAAMTGCAGVGSEEPRRVVDF